MRLGKLNRKVAIKYLDPGQDDIGQPIGDAPLTLATVWADIRFPQGLETIKAGAQTSVVTGSVRIRRRTDVKASMWLEVDGIKLQITAVLPDMEDRARLDLTCKVIS